MFALGNATFACSVCSARKRWFEEARGETEVGRGLLAPEPRPLPPLASRTRPAGMQSESQLEPATSALFCPKLDNFCCNATRHSCGNNCNVVVKLAQEYHCFLTHFTSVLRKQFVAYDMFLREANSYKRALVLRNLRLVDKTLGN